MFFCTYERYYDDEPIYYLNKKNEEGECFICFEIKLNDEKNPIKLKHQLLYIKTCSCDSFVHKNCLQIWIDKNSNCPICRKSINNFVINRNIYSGIFIYFRNATIISNKIIKVLYCLLLCYFLLSYYILYDLTTYNSMYEDLLNRNVTYIN